MKTWERPRPHQTALYSARVLFQNPAHCELGKFKGVWVAGATSISVDVADFGTDEMRDLEPALAAVPVMLAGGSKTHGRAGRSARTARRKAQL